jgi:hypothetical protein
MKLKRRPEHTENRLSTGVCSREAVRSLHRDHMIHELIDRDPGAFVES